MASTHVTLKIHAKDIAEIRHHCAHGKGVHAEQSWAVYPRGSGNITAYIGGTVKELEAAAIAMLQAAERFQERLAAEEAEADYARQS